MKDKNLHILSPRTSNSLLYIYNNLVDTCIIALILFLKYDVTKFRILAPLCHTMSHFLDPLRPLNV